jgi:hypothetical protein
MGLSLSDVLGWVTSLMTTLGLMVFVAAALVIFLVISFIEKMTHKG